MGDNGDFGPDRVGAEDGALDGEGQGAFPTGEEAGESAATPSTGNLELEIEKLRGDLDQREAALAQREKQVETLRGERVALTEAYREAVIAANPDVVAELVSGSTIEEIAASLEGARMVFQKAKEAARAELRTEAVSTGNFTRSEAGRDVETLSPGQKISLGLQKS